MSLFTQFQFVRYESFKRLKLYLCGQSTKFAYCLFVSFFVIIIIYFFVASFNNKLFDFSFKGISFMETMFNI